MEYCDVNWGSHGCVLPLFHDGPHECDCCDCPDHETNQGRRFDPGDKWEWRCVAKPPYFGPETKFWGSVWHANSED